MATSILDKDDVSVETLSNMFKKGLDINDELENTGLSSNSDEFQHKVRKGILLLEDATRLVSLLDLFSRNETVSEVPTEHLKYFLLDVTPLKLRILDFELTNKVMAKFLL